MKLAYVNPNSTAAMTEAVVKVARAVLPDAHVLGFTNAEGPPAIEAGAEPTRARLAAEIGLARDADGAGALVLGCAGMAPLRDDLARRTRVRLIDGVEASAFLAHAAAGFARLTA